ncbi:F0F1 ATP synthase subunit delta [Sphingomonas naphthae]|uniref:ATP synthase subunit delta n=1 Tax=Sphingomonas naphthae TaxID=1813468 RepID=A0ABY7TH51_9SPHN|nr:F0F1 ATP synthase subunit delta [Sphingomonas naphthae]WCT72485.1 F0F1 ATP synthase subunit delta [Sphingomonas naphthae]
MDMSGGIEASLGGRYASALFDLAREEKLIDIVSSDLRQVKAAIAESPEFRLLIASPLVSRDEAGNAIAAVAGSLEIDPLTAKFLGVLAQNRRLADLPKIIKAYETLASRHRGETTAQVVSARPLSDDQVTALKAKLKDQLRRDVTVDLSVDPAILGGLIVKVGSKQIDGSIRTKLNSLAQAMKG